MTREEFVEGVEIAVRRSTIREMTQVLKGTLAAQPESEKKLAMWYNTLSAEEKDSVSGVIDLSVDLAIFGLFCVLDGVRAVERGPENGELNLTYSRRNQSISLSGPEGEPLHDIYRQYMQT